MTNRNTLRLNSATSVQRNSSTGTFTLETVNGPIEITAKLFLTMQALREKQMTNIAYGKVFITTNGG